MADNLDLSVSIDFQLARFEKAMRDAGRLTASTTAGMDKATKRAAQSFDRLEGALDPASRALTRLDRDTAKVQRALDKGAISSDRAAAVQKRLNDQYEATVARLNNVTTASTRTAAAVNDNSAAIARHARTATRGAGSTRSFANAAQQAGYQIGDFAVQVASGQNAMVAFLQQGTQILQFFGPWGAVIGAAGAVIGGLVVGLTNFGDAAEDAEDAAERYTRAIEESERAMRSAESISISLAEEKRREAIKTLENAAAIERETMARKMASLELLRAQKLEMQSRNQFLPNQDTDSYLQEPIDRVMGDILESEQKVADAEKRINALRNPSAESALGEDLGMVSVSGMMRELASDRERAQAVLDERLRDIEQLRIQGVEEAKLTELTARAYAEYEAAVSKADRASRKKREGLTDFQKALQAVNKELDGYETAARSNIAALEQENRLIQLRINGQDELADRLQYEARMREQLGPLYDQYADKLGEIYERNKRLTGQFEEQEAAIGYLENIGERAFDRIGSAITQAFTQGEGAAINFGSIAQGVLSELMQSFIELAAINPLKNALFGQDNQVLGDVIGSIAGSLFGGGQQVYSVPAGPMPADFVGPMPAFASGGAHSGGLRLVGERGPEVEATGPARIWSADQTAKMLGGGAAPKISVTVINNSDAEVSTQTRTDGNGNVSIEHMVDKAVGKQLGTQGSASNKALRQNFGATPVLARR